MNFNLASSVNVEQLSTIGTGAISTKRIGNVLKCYSLTLKGEIEQASGAEEVIRARVVLFIDWQNQGVLPSVDDLFFDIVEYNRNFPRSQDSYKFVRYTFLWDEFVNLSSAGLDIAGTGMINFRYIINKYFKIKHKIYYTGGNGLVGENSKGTIFLMVADANGGNAFRVKSVLKFTDV